MEKITKKEKEKLPKHCDPKVRSRKVASIVRMVLFLRKEDGQKGKNRVKKKHTVRASSELDANKSEQFYSQRSSSAARIYSSTGSIISSRHRSLPGSGNKRDTGGTTT